MRLRCCPRPALSRGPTTLDPCPLRSLLGARSSEIAMLARALGLLAAVYILKRVNPSSAGAVLCPPMQINRAPSARPSRSRARPL